METKEMKAAISNNISKSARNFFICWIVFFLLFISLGFAFFNIDYDLTWYGLIYGWIDTWDWETHIYDGGIWLFLILFINLLVMVMVPLIYFLIGWRKRKLSELTANEKEIVGSYTSFIPISKITLKMPIEKIDNIGAVKNIFFLYTGKSLRIGSTSNVIKIPYVLNADKMVAFISEAIEKAKNRPMKLAEGQEKPQPDAMESLKKLSELRDAGIITEEEFHQKKNELLGKI